MFLKKKIKSIIHKFHTEEDSLDTEDEESLYYFFYNVVQTNKEINSHEELISRFPLYGLASAFKKFQTNEELKQFEEEAVIKFADKFTVCTLNADKIS